MTNYQKMAVDFLKRTGTECEIVFSRCGKYFEEDVEARNIYDVTFTRVVDGIEKEFTVEFGDSVINTKEENVPTEYDVLACLTKYDIGNIDDFCDEFGYRSSWMKVSKIIKIYEDVKKEWEMVQMLFGDVLDELREIQ